MGPAMRATSRPIISPGAAARYFPLPLLTYLAMQLALLLFAAIPQVTFTPPVYVSPTSVTGPQIWVSPLGGVPWKEAAARMNVLANMLLFVAAALALLAKTVGDVMRLFDLTSRLVALLAAGATALLGIVTVLPGTIGLIPRYRSLLGSELFSRAAQRFANSFWGTGTFETIAAIMDVATTVAAFCLLLQMVSCAGRFSGISETDSWKFQADRLKFYTYIASTFMIVGILTSRAWMSYPEFMLTDAQAVAFRSAVNGFSTYLGVAYSLIIGSVAIPVAYDLYRSANQIVGQSLDPPLPPGAVPFHSVLLDGARRKSGLLVTPQDVLKTIAAVLGPFAAGTVSGFPVFG